MGKKLCSICGENNATTNDHLPPRSIYPKPIDGGMNMHTVPACTSCNGGGSKEDEEFKLFMGLETGEFRDNPDKLIDSLAGTMSHNKRLAAQIFSNHKKGYAKYRGPIAEKVVAIEFNSSAYHLVISRIVRGLYWRETGEALGTEPEIDVFSACSLDSSKVEIYKLKELMAMLSPKSLNKDTFVYKSFVDEDGSSFWGMQFFHRHAVFAVAEAKKT